MGDNSVFQNWNVKFFSLYGQMDLPVASLVPSNIGSFYAISFENLSKCVKCSYQVFETLHHTLYLPNLYDVFIVFFFHFRITGEQCQTKVDCL